MRSLWLDTHPITLPNTAGSDGALGSISPASFTPGTHYDAVVAGAGITGLTTAVLLSRAGKKVVVVEARSIGAVATGNTTAKVSLLQGTMLSGIRSHQDDETLRAYVEGNREAQAWLLHYLDEREVPYQRRTAYTYATTEQGQNSLEKELEACRTAGLDVAWTEDTELPFPVTGALALPNQAQIHPMTVLEALVSELDERGGTVFEGVRVTDATPDGGNTQDDAGPLTVETTAGALHADQLVLATGAPILDRGGYFAKLKGNRSYALTYRLPAEARADIPQGMYLSADSPSRTTRTVPMPQGTGDGGEELLLVGGNDHVVGRPGPEGLDAESHQAAVDDLEAWTQEHFPGAERTHVWAAQDYRASAYVPYIGALPRGGGNIYVATGFNKWGMTNGVAAALAISSEILHRDNGTDGTMPWAKTLMDTSVTASGLLTGVKDNLEVGAHMVTDWAKAELRNLPGEAPAEGQGIVGRRDGRPVAVSTVDGTTCALSAVCPHMGGILTWNDAERSWDCPLHASRFSHDGTLLEGPAVDGLKPMD